MFLGGWSNNVGVSGKQSDTNTIEPTVDKVINLMVGPSLIGVKFVKDP